MKAQKRKRNNQIRLILLIALATLLVVSAAVVVAKQDTARRQAQAKAYQDAILAKKPDSLSGSWQYSRYTNRSDKVIDSGYYAFREDNTYSFSDKEPGSSEREGTYEYQNGMLSLDGREALELVHCPVEYEMYAITSETIGENGEKTVTTDFWAKLENREK